MKTPDQGTLISLLCVHKICFDCFSQASLQGDPKFQCSIVSGDTWAEQGHKMTRQTWIQHQGRGTSKHAAGLEVLALSRLPLRDQSVHCFLFL